jgi:hypothetical protein
MQADAGRVALIGDTGQRGLALQPHFDLLGTQSWKTAPHFLQQPHEVEAKEAEFWISW